MDVDIRKLKSGDEAELKDLVRLYVEVFGEPSYPSTTNHLATLLSNEAIMLVAAYVSGQLVGGLTAYLLPSVYGNYNELCIYDVAVLSEYQRQGIGAALLNYVKEHSKNSNVRTVFVQADAVDVEARNFYKKNGGIEEDVRHYNFNVSDE